MDIKNCIDEDNKDEIKGFVLVGANNTGKTYQILDILKKLIIMDQKIQYTLTSAIFLSKEMNKHGISHVNTGPFTKTIKPTLENILELGSEIIIDFENDTINNESLEEIIVDTIILKENYYNLLLNELLSINLIYDKESKELLIFSEEEFEEYKSPEKQSDLSYYYLKSSGYVSLIRNIVILDNLLSPEIKWVLIDEPDDSLDTLNRQLFINILEKLKQRKGSTAKIIFSTHNSETLYSLPENYIIYKLVNKKVIEKYYSQDFFSKSKLEAKLFNQKNEDIYRGEDITKLLEIYRNKLEGKLYSSTLNLDTYEPLSIKEKIIFNAIKKLGV